MKENSVIFDLDGTLWDSSAQVAECWSQVGARLLGPGFFLTPDDVKAQMGKTMDEIAFSLLGPSCPADRAKEVGKELISPNITFYSMRHTFATIYMSNPSANPVHLATMMGRSVNGIYRYVKSLQSVDDIIDEREKIFEQYD